MTAEAWITGTPPYQKINFRLPTGGKGEKGDAGAPGRDGSNVVPTASAIADEVGTSGTPARNSLDATYMRFVSVLTYGAVGDGVTDDTLAIQSAINDAGARGVVYFPNRRNASGEVTPYLVTNELLISVPQVTLLGDKSEYGPQIKRATPGYIIRSSTYSTTIQGLVFKGDGDTAVTPYTPQVDGIIFDRGDSADLDHRVIDCTFLTLRQGIKAVGRNVDMMGNLFSQCVSGVRVEPYGTQECRGYRINRNRFHSLGLGSGTELAGADSVCVEFTSAAAFGNEVCGNMSDSSCRLFYRGPLDRTKVNDNHLYNMVGTGLEILAPVAGTSWFGWSVSNNTFYGSYNAGWDATALGNAKSTPDNFLKSLGTLAGGVLGPNSVTNTRKHAYDLAGFYNAFMAGGVIINAGMYRSIEGVLYDGINITAGSGATIGTHRIRNTSSGGVASHRYGINLGASTGMVVSPQHITESATADINSPSGTNTIMGAAPGMVDMWFPATGTQQFGLRMFKSTATDPRKQFAEVVALSQSDSAGGEKANVLVRTQRNGTLGTVASFTWNGALTIEGAPSPQDTAGYLNATALNAALARFVPRAATGVPNNSMFVDSADNALKFRDNSGTLRTVNLT